MQLSAAGQVCATSTRSRCAQPGLTAVPAGRAGVSSSLLLAMVPGLFAVLTTVPFCRGQAYKLQHNTY